MAKRKSERGIVLSRDALLQARKVKHNMTQEALATAALLDVREIQRAENEQPIDPVFAHRIARILGVDLADLVKKSPMASTDTPQKQRDSQRASVPDSSTIPQSLEKLFSAIAYAGNYKPPFKAVALKKLSELALFLGMEDGYDEDDVDGEDGSLIISVPLSRRDAAKLVNSFIAGELQQFNVVSVTVAASATGRVNGGTRRSLVETPLDDVRGRLALLSPKQMDVLRLMLNGNSNKTIAERLQISVRSVEVRRKAILDKLRVNSSAGLVRLIIYSAVPSIRKESVVI